MIALRVPARNSVLEKFTTLMVGTVYKYHLKEIFKFSMNQIRNAFKILTIGVQNRATRNKNLNVWNFADKNEMLNSCVILITNALRKWGYYLLIR